MSDRPPSAESADGLLEHDTAVPAEIRRDRMLQLIDSREFVRVSELVERFGVSDVTVRTDLATLARSGLVRRVHGGVRRAISARTERSFEETARSSSAAKAAIAAAAAAMVDDGDSILVDVGTTTTALATALAAREDLAGVTVFTNGLRVAAELESAVPRMTVVVTGGTLRPLQHSLVEPLASLMLSRIRPGVLFLGATGVDVRHGITNVNLPEAELKSAMLAAAARTVLLADGSKFGRVDVARIAAVSDVDAVITDRSASTEMVQAVRAAGVDVIVADSTPA